MIAKRQQLLKIFLGIGRVRVIRVSLIKRRIRFIVRIVTWRASRLVHQEILRQLERQSKSEDNGKKEHAHIMCLH